MHASPSFVSALSSALQVYPVLATCLDVNGEGSGLLVFPCDAGYTLKSDGAEVDLHPVNTREEASSLCCDKVS